MADSQYRCVVVEWLDGDTAVLDVTATFLSAPITIRQHARIFGINAPEVRSTDAAQKQLGLAAKKFAESIAPIGCQAFVSPPAPGKWRDKYGRLLAVMSLPGGSDFATAMVAAKHALPWDGQGEKPIPGPN